MKSEEEEEEIWNSCVEGGRLRPPVRLAKNDVLSSEWYIGYLYPRCKFTFLDEMGRRGKHWRISWELNKEFFFLLEAWLEMKSEEEEEEESESHVWRVG